MDVGPVTVHDSELLAIRSTELRRILPLGVTKIYEELKAGRLTAVKAGSRTYISRGEVARYIENLPRLGASGAA